MKKLLKFARCAALLAAGWTWTGATFAQQPFSDVPVERPTVSPYLNLLNSAPGVPTYQTLVRPEIQARNQLFQNQVGLQQLQQQVSSGRSSVTPDTGGKIRGTGHETEFMNLSHYYRTARTNTAAR